MSLSAAVQTTLFKHKNGVSSAAAAVIRRRFISFLIWQSILAALTVLLAKSLLLCPFKCKSPSILPLLPFLPIFPPFLLRQCLRSLRPTASQAGLSARPPPPIGPAGFLSTSNSALPADACRGVGFSLNFVLFAMVSALSGPVSLVSVRWSCGAFGQTRPWRAMVLILGFRGFLAGLFYGMYYVYKQRWVLQFPIIQCPLFFSFKMGLPSAIGRALKVATAAYFFSSVIVFCSMMNMKERSPWVMQTKSFMFAPPKGSAATETNPSEYLLSALEESTPKSLLQHLAYLDLCMVCERNVDTWCRAAFFEETSETYKRVIAVCLIPLEQFTSKLVQSLDASSVQKSSQLSDQLRLPTDRLADSRLLESFNDFQLCAWCARIVSSLTARFSQGG